MKVVVIDTNILVSRIILPNSTTSKAFEKAANDYSVIISPQVAVEYIEIFQREKFDKYFERSKRMIFLSHFLDGCINITPTDKITECRDAEDNKFLELAATGRADYIITGDDDLLCPNPFRGVKILSATEFLEIT